MTAAHRLDASFFGDPGNGPAGPQRRTALLRTDTAGFSELDNFGGHNQTVRYSGDPDAVLAGGGRVRPVDQRRHRNPVAEHVLLQRT